MTNLKIVFIATNAFEDVVATKTFNTQFGSFDALSTFAQNEEKQFANECLKNIEERTWIQMRSFTIDEDEVDVYLGV